MYMQLSVICYLYNNITGAKLKGLVTRYQKRAMNTHTNDTSEPGNIHLSNGLIQSHETLSHVYSMNMPRWLWIDFMKISYLFLVWGRFALALASPFFLCLKRLHC